MIDVLGLEDLSNLWLNIMTMLLGDKESSMLSLEGAWMMHDLLKLERPCVGKPPLSH